MDVFDTFDGSKPNLVSSRTLKDIEIKLNVPDNIDNSNKVFNSIGTFYSDYIMPNLFPLIVISLFIIYLAIRYVLKRDQEERDEVETEKIEKRDRINKHIIKTNQKSSSSSTNQKSSSSPINQNDENFGINNGDNVDNADKNKNTYIDDQVDLSDIISDDYLLTDDDDYDEEKYNENIMRQVMERGSPHDIEKATNLFFNQ